MYLSELFIYPIKSLRGISLKNAKIERRGLEFDRRWMLVDEKNKFLTQREFPKMAAISIDILEKGLEISAEGFENIIMPFEVSGDAVNVQVWQSVCPAIPCQKQVNEWFSEVLQSNCQIVYMFDKSERKINPLFAENNEIVSFADGYPFLLIGQNSLDDLNEKLALPLPMNRFRPNLVVEGSGAFAEDLWNKIKIGKTLFRATKPCVRCVVTTIDQKKGFFSGKEPLKTLAGYRKAKDVIPDDIQKFGLSRNDVLFGQNFVAENFDQIIKIGDKVEILT